MRSLAELIADLYKIVEDLSKKYPGRKFTPDGHLMGSIGEAVAKEVYGVKLVSASTKDHDGFLNGKTVQIKLTAGIKIQTTHTSDYADKLIVLRLNKETGFTEKFAGDFPVDFINSKKLTSHKYHQCSVAALEQLNTHTIEQVQKMETFNSQFRKGLR
jgi:hypothetical protein